MKPVPGLPIEQQPEPVLFACVLCGEARNGGYASMAAVAQSIMNRLQRPKRFGATIKDVLLKPWQYSCLNANDPNREAMLDFWHTEAAAYAIAEGVASKAAAGALEDTVGPATHYVVLKLWGRDDADRIAAGHAPAWHSKQCIEDGTTKETARVGGHVFAVTA